MLGLQGAHVRAMTDDVAERLSALWGGPSAPWARWSRTLGGIGPCRSASARWTRAHPCDRQAVTKPIGEMDAVSEDLLIEQLRDLKQFQSIRAHLETVGGTHHCRTAAETESRRAAAMTASREASQATESAWRLDAALVGFSRIRSRIA